jgi:hypothetical protein
LNFRPAKFIGKVVSSLIIEFVLALEPGLSLWIILEKWNLLVNFLLMENVISSFVLGALILYYERTYGLALDGTRSAVELRLVRLLVGDELVLLVQRVREIVMEFGRCDFGSVGVGALDGVMGTFSLRSLPNLSSTKLPTRTPWRYLFTESMTE